MGRKQAGLPRQPVQFDAQLVGRAVAGQALVLFVGNDALLDESANTVA